MTIAQNAAFQPFEVDSIAEPRGGMPYLNTFLQTNLRKPVRAAADGISGRVILSAIINPDASVSDITLARSLRPDCDQEAMRVFRLFRAWRPAYKDGKPVRQLVSVPVAFTKNEPFLYVGGVKISHYDEDEKAVTDSSQAQYKQLLPLDSVGMPTGDLVVYKRKPKGWAEAVRLPLQRKKHWKRGPSKQTLFLTGHQDADGQWLGRVYTVDETGTLVEQTDYEEGQRVGSAIQYHANGVVAEKSDELTEGYALSSWYPSGQIQQIWQTGKLKQLERSTPERVLSFWDSTGRQLITEGNGPFLTVKRVESKRDTTQQTDYTEQGQYVGGLREGIWTGRYADDSYGYEERYEKGICQAGKAFSADGDTTRYTEREKQPEFKGGLTGLGEFLSQNLHYPSDAQRARIEGKVFVSFVVCTDGTLCDYEVLKGVAPSVDQEALRVIKKMSGRWKPGYERGKPVRVKYNLPINFMLH
ncbi:energy transducer TonB [Spirosoma montaniterrae]|uniref:energy transducer TonB n=1 Tax=Spirosoma montaniterrae TaxID=1178516 RepID=UPI001E4E15C5|nr:energy transducer TonB [Spirosoma montaniterrae]